MADGPVPEALNGERGPHVLRDPWLWVPLVLAVAATVAVYPRLPERMAIHWNVAGQPDGWAPRALAAWAGLAMAAGFSLLFALLPALDPRRENYRRFAGAYRIVCRALLLFLLGAHSLVVLAGLGLPVAVERVVPLGIGILLLVLGNVLGQVRPNYFVGIRTPWTLASEEVWRRTHRMAGWLFVAAGLVTAAGALAGGVWAAGVLLTSTLGATLGSAVYSYWLWRRIQGRHAG